MHGGPVCCGAGRSCRDLKEQRTTDGELRTEVSMGRITAVWISLALLWACSSPTGVADPVRRLIVTSYLMPGTDTVVKVRRTVASERFYAGLEDTVAAAQVQIESAGRVTELAEDAAEPGTYRVSAAALPVVSGATYALRVVAGDQELTATTTVPGPVAVTQVSADTVVYYQQFGDLYGELVHPGQFRWSRSEGAAGYGVIVTAPAVRAAGPVELPLTGRLRQLMERRAALAATGSPDTLAALDRQIDALRLWLAANVSLVRSPGDTIRWLRDSEQADWDAIAAKDWDEARQWQERMERLFQASRTEYFVPPDTLRSDYWWAGIRFEGECRVRVLAVDRNYFDYAATAANGLSGNDGDRGPVFHTRGGFGVFGSCTQDSFSVFARRSDDGLGLKIMARH